MRRLMVLGLYLGLAFPAQARMFDPKVFTLDNGLQVVVVENHRAPIAEVMVWYKVGAADETPGKSGLAHLLEHMMFKGTPTIAPGEFSKIIARSGGRDNAFTSSDYTAYYQDVASANIEQAFTMEADRMHNLVFDEKNFVTERAVVMEERRSRTDNNPNALLHEAMGAAMFLNHPYHRPVIGWRDEIAQLSRDDALDFYHRWYAPNNAVLVVEGDVDPARVLELAKTHFGPIPKADTPVRARPQEPGPIAAREVTLKDGRVQQPALVRQWLAPSLRSGGPEQADALEVLAEILGGGSSGRLYRALVVEKGLAASLYVGYDPASWDADTLTLSAVPRPGVALAKLRAGVEAELARLEKNGVTATEVAEAKNRLTAGLAYERDSLHAGAHRLGEALTTGETVEQVESWPERIAAVTPDAVNQIAKTVLDDRRSVTGTLLPLPGAAGSAPPMALPAFGQEIR